VLNGAEVFGPVCGQGAGLPAVALQRFGSIIPLAGSHGICQVPDNSTCRMQVSI